MLTIKVQRLHPEAQLPVRAHPGDAGLDLFSVEAKTLPPGEFDLVHTGIAIELPQGAEAQLRPRSGLARKYGVTLLNSPGTLDEGYRGEVCVLMINHGAQPFIVEPGMRIAQMVIATVCPAVCLPVETLSGSDRGTAGFGSSGK